MKNEVKMKLISSYEDFLRLLLPLSPHISTVSQNNSAAQALELSSLEQLRATTNLVLDGISGDVGKKRATLDKTVRDEIYGAFSLNRLSISLTRLRLKILLNPVGHFSCQRCCCRR